MFHKKGKFGGKLVFVATDCSISEKRNFGGRFFRGQKVIFRKRNSFRRKCKISNFLHTKIFWINLKVFISSHHFLCHAKSWFCSKFSTNPHWCPFPTATKITCSFPFHRLLAAASTHCNYDFPQKPILRLLYSSSFAPVQSLKAVSDTESYNFYKKYACVEL